MHLLPLLLALVSSPARADTPPEGIDLEDIDHWEDHAFDLTRGPAGCWALRGTLQTRIVLYQPATLLTRPSTQELVLAGTLDGELQDGQWTVLRYDVAHQDGTPYREDLSFTPLVGELASGAINVNRTAEPEPEPEPEPAPVSVETGKKERKERSISISIGDDGESNSSEGDAGASVNLLQDSIHRWWSASMVSSYARWDGAAQGVELVIEVPTGESATADVVTGTVFFPGGGTLPTRIDSVLPKRLTVGEGLVRAHVIDGQLHLRGRVLEGGLLLPTEESVSAVLGALGFTVGFEQTIRYTEARTCPGDGGAG